MITVLNNEHERGLENIKFQKMYTRYLFQYFSEAQVVTLAKRTLVVFRWEFPFLTFLNS